ncbi:hypothetical protein N8I74_09975 [Chitiniphilus purpureus]|uniref:Uncharacterized protein n=1 Tax=Chitiniphilus purpureus TaxID=2981137 RepID=A0ABY6DH59_9NEIS|nr:hypothetical protein [Chitiniphilus sp. CD1]UXY13651.1 hypothetical protein N8I74_09975 [Chitiniphilus sp. CD1]
MGAFNRGGLYQADMIPVLKGDVDLMKYGVGVVRDEWIEMDDGLLQEKRNTS